MRKKSAKSAYEHFSSKQETIKVEMHKISQHLFIKGYPENMPEFEIQTLFEKYGKLTNINLRRE